MAKKQTKQPANPVIIQVGKTSVNVTEAKAMGKDAFRKATKGRISVDFDALWKRVQAGK